MIIHHIGVSGGKDSQAVLLWAIHESGIPRECIRVTFCNTHNEDRVTYDHVRMLSKLVCEANGYPPIEWLEPEIPIDPPPDLPCGSDPYPAFFLLALWKRRFPSRKAQFCTDHLKLRPTQKWIKARMLEGHTIVAISGVRADESEARKNLPEREWSDMFACEVWRPLLRWTIEDVYAISHKYGLPLNPLYGMGAKRVGCFPCVNCGKREIKIVAKHRPEKIAEIESWEKRVGQNRSYMGYSSFFPAKTVTAPFRLGPYKNKDGEDCWYTTIRNVVSWAKTARGGRQYELQFDEDTHSACSARYGQCE